MNTDMICVPHSWTAQGAYGASMCWTQFPTTRGTHVIPTLRMVHGYIGKTAVYICVSLSVADHVQSEEPE